MTTRRYLNFIAVGSCYIDTVLSVPHYPLEDTKLRATGQSQRRGGNCPNVLEVLQQLACYDQLTSGHHVASGDGTDTSTDPCRRHRHYNLALFLISILPDRNSSDTGFIIDSFENDPFIQGWIDLDHCIYKEGQIEAATSYAIFSSQTGSRTIVNYNELGALQIPEFDYELRTIKYAHGLSVDRSRGVHFHFEGRDPAMVFHCSNEERQLLNNVTISVDIEKAGSPGMEIYKSLVEFAFFSKSWAMSAGYQDAASCLRSEAAKCTGPRLVRALFCTWGPDGAAGCFVTDPHHLLVVHRPAWTPPVMNGTVDSRTPIVDTTGAGDTWIASMLYTVLYMTNHTVSGQMNLMLDFANETAGRKIRRMGFKGLGEEMSYLL